jgi:hypothetical protein
VNYSLAFSFEQQEAAFCEQQEEDAFCSEVQALDFFFFFFVGLSSFTKDEY